MHLSGGGLAWHVLVLDLIPSTASSTPEQEVILIITFSYMHLHFFEPGMVAHAFNRHTWEAKEGGFMSWRPIWST